MKSAKISVAARPTPRMAAILALSIPLAAVLLAVLGSRWPAALYFPAMCLVMLIADFSMTPPGPLECRLELGEAVRLAAPSAARLVVEPPRRLFGGARPLEAALEVGGPAGLLSDCRAAGALTAEGASLEIQLSPARRGRLAIKKLWLRWPGPLGLCRIRQLEVLGAEVPVVQDISGLHQAALMFFHRDASAGQKSQPFKGEGSEFDSLMEWQPGMDNRLIDWKHSARHHKLLAKDLRRERNHQIILGFDTGRLMTEPVGGIPKLDHFVRAALSLAWVSLLNGDMVGACGFDLVFRSFLKPGRGRAFFGRLMRFASELDYRAEETNFTASLTELKGRLPHRSLVVVFTEFIDAVAAELLVEGLALLAKKHMVLFVTTPDPLLSSLRDAPPDSLASLASAVIAEGFQRDRAMVLQRAARQGVHCLDVPPGAMTTAILNRYLVIKQRGLL